MVGGRLSYIAPALYTNQAQGDVDIDGDLLALPRAAAIVHAGEQHHFKLVYGSASQDNRSARYSEKERIRALDLIYFTRSARWFATVSAYRNWAYNVLSVVQRVDPMTGEYQNEQDNSGRLSIYGAELLASLALIDELRVEGSVTGRTTIDLENPEAEPAYSPHWLAKGRLSYSRWGLTAAATVRFVDGMLPPIEWGSTEGEFNRIGAVVPGYAVLGANLRYDWFDSGFYGNLRASNLTGTGIRYPANELVNFERGAPALDREVLLTVGWQR